MVPANAGLVRTDIVQQFFLARISVGAVWDDVLKNNDHYDAMMTMKRRHVKSYIDFRLKILHNKESCQYTHGAVSQKYARVRRSRWMELMPYILKKWNLSRYHDEVGRVWSVDEATGRIQTACGV